MKHLIINDYGIFLGLKSARVVVKKDGSILKETSLNRLKTIQVTSKGVTLSSDLIEQCSLRGIKIFIHTFNSFSAIASVYEHKTSKVRQNQFLASSSKVGLELAKNLIIGKLKNQRATMLYSSRAYNSSYKSSIIEIFNTNILKLKNKKEPYLEFILGIEGICASYYFEFLKELNLLPNTFNYRTKRHSTEITNIALNYGYAILFNFIYKACINAGLEPYVGVLHTQRSAKPSLVLDIIEEYRSFVVDRNIIKLRSKLQKTKDFQKIKNEVAKNILTTISKKYKYNHKKLTLESIIQRQVYKISGYFCNQSKYKPYIFRW